MIRLMAFGFVVTASVFSVPAFAQTQEEIDACTPDAFRLCEEFIPDREKVKACLIRKRGQLSPACRRAFR